MPNAAESSVVERDIALARETEAHIHVAHLSTREALEAVRAAKKAKHAGDAPKSRRITSLWSTRMLASSTRTTR